MNNINISLFPHSKTQVKVVNDLTPEMLRTHCVSVRLNHRELTKLNTLRGYYAKGEWLRMVFLHELPAIVPSINIEAWKYLADINQTIQRIAKHLDAKSSDSLLTKTEIFVIKTQISELRQKLISSDSWSKPDEGYAEDTER